jgi:hypothetical protein
MGTWLNYRLESMWKPGQDIIDFALTEVDDREKREIRSFLKKALAANLTRQQLQLIWNRGDTNIFIPDEREFRNYIQWIIVKIDAAVGPD